MVVRFVDLNVLDPSINEKPCALSSNLGSETLLQGLQSQCNVCVDVVLEFIVIKFHFYELLNVLLLKT